MAHTHYLILHVMYLKILIDRYICVAFQYTKLNKQHVCIWCVVYNIQYSTYNIKCVCLHNILINLYKNTFVHFVFQSTYHVLIYMQYTSIYCIENR